MTLTATGGAGSRRRRRPRPQAALRTWRTLSPYAYIAPFFTLFAAFGLFPLIYTAFVSLYRVELQTPGDMEWRGLDNYTALLRGRVLLDRAAQHLHHRRAVHRAAAGDGAGPRASAQLPAARPDLLPRTAMLLPYATSVAAATLVFAQLFGRDFGLINYAAGAGRVRSRRLADRHRASQIAVSTIVIWRWTGYNALIYLAGMQSIPSELYEAAEMDGASRWQQFLHVTLPGLRPTILFTVVVSTIGATQLFGEPLLFEGSISGGIRTSTRRSACTCTSRAGASSTWAGPPPSPG